MKIPLGLVAALLLATIFFGLVSYGLSNWYGYVSSHHCLVGKVQTFKHETVTVAPSMFSNWTTISVVWLNGTVSEHSSGGPRYWQFVWDPIFGTSFDLSYVKEHIVVQTNSTLILDIYDQDRKLGSLVDGRFEYTYMSLGTVGAFRDLSFHGPFFRFGNPNTIPVTVVLDLSYEGTLYVNPYSGGCYAWS